MRGFVVSLLALAGCSAAHYVASADREGNAILAEKMRVVEEFRSNLVDPTKEVPLRSTLPPPEDVPAEMTLDEAIRIGTLYNRDYLAQKENFFLTALGLGLTRRDFQEFVYSGTLSYDGSDGSSRTLADTTALALSGTRFLPTGGRVTVSTNGSISTGELGQDTAVSGTISFTQPLARGAGRFVAYEPLTQAERNVVYAARDFETFRQNFAIDVEARFLDLLRQKQSIRNTERRVANQEFTLRQAQALYRLRRGTQVDVFRAERTYRDAKNALLDDRQAYQRSLDDFKIFLGLPIDVEFDVVGEIPTDIEEWDVDTEAAIVAALANRLDLKTQRDRVEDTSRQVRIAKNALLPDIGLDASYTASSLGANSLNDVGIDDHSVTFGVSVEIPLDRKGERNAYRSALIGLDQAQRGLLEREDRIMLEIRDSVRRLRRELLQIRNDEETVESLRRQVLRADLDNRAGVGSNRDIVEAVDQLTEARNGLLGRYANYEITRLRLIQAMGLLFVDEQGRIIP